tara:strand:+ start:107 stop:493 length:387 start_codon:yes stop_codon:yes gene_type:complete
MIRANAMILTLMILAVPLSGCAGDDDDDSLVGVWFFMDSAVLNFNENGTGAVSGDFFNWSTDGDALTIADVPNEDGDGTMDIVYTYAIDEDWLWIHGHGECYLYSSESIQEADWESRISETTAPSFCQ